jgi:hypothetical protein
MERMVILAGILFLSTALVWGTLYPGSASAQDNDNFVFSASSNSTWVLDKTTKKLIYMQFLKEDMVWKSKTVIIPEAVNLRESKLEAVGARGTGLFTIFCGVSAHQDHNTGCYEF